MKDKEKSRGDQLREALCYDKKNGYDRVNREELEAMEAYCTGYKQFLDAGKTERECVDRTVALAEAAGFREYKRGMDAEARGQGVPGEPGQVRHAGGDGPEGPGGGREHRGRPHRLPPSGFEAEPPL